MKAPTIPTIKNLLNSMPKEGMIDAKTTLTTYASLSFYYDGEDMKQAKVNKIKAKQLVIDSAAPQIPDFQIVESDDVIDLLVGSDVYRLDIPSLKTMPEIKADNVPASFIKAIENLAENPEQIFNLPYTYFPAVIELVGKSIGI